MPILIVFFLIFGPYVALAAESPAIRIEVTKVIDGDTLEPRTGPPIRLWGFDAPERGEYGYWAAGAALEALIAKSAVLECRARGNDPYGRKVMQCQSGSKDVGRIMVRSGWARDMKQFSGGFYAADEEYALEKGRGLWHKK